MGNLPKHECVKLELRWYRSGTIELELQDYADDRPIGETWRTLDTWSPGLGAEQSFREALFAFRAYSDGILNRHQPPLPFQEEAPFPE